MPDDLIPIDEAAKMLKRTVWTVRSWETRGFAPNGMVVTAYRDEFTTIRYFRRVDIERIRDAMFPARLHPSRP